MSPDEEAAAVGVVIGELMLEVLKRGDQVVPAQTPHDLAKAVAVNAILLLVEMNAPKEKGPEPKSPEPDETCGGCQRLNGCPVHCPDRW